MDFELRGCPINKYQLIELITATLAGRKPNIPTYSVCMECKRKGNVCIAVAQGVACLGPVTQAGCGALCPSYNRGCYGCYGPMESPNTASLTSQFRILGPGRRGDHPRVPQLQRLGVAVPQGQRGERADMSRATDEDYQGRLSGASRRRGRALRQAEGRSGSGREAQDLRAAATVRSVSARPALLRSAGHRGAHLRNLSHRIPDERGARRRDTRWASRSTRQCGCCGGCSTAASGSRAMRCTSSCCTRRIFWAIPMPSQMARDHQAVVEQGLRLKKAGNRIVTLMGGREIHPVSAAVGGFYKVPSKSALRELVGRTEVGARCFAGHGPAGCRIRISRFRAGLRVCVLSHPDEYPFNEGRIVSNRGLDIDVVRSMKSISSSSTSNIPMRCIPCCVAAVPTWSARWRASI